MRGVDGAPAAPDGALPEGWRAVFDDDSGRVFYWHVESGATTWERPAGDGAAPEEEEKQGVDELMAALFVDDDPAGEEQPLQGDAAAAIMEEHRAIVQADAAAEGDLFVADEGGPPSPTIASVPVAVPPETPAPARRVSTYAPPGTPDDRAHHIDVMRAHNSTKPSAGLDVAAFGAGGVDTLRSHLDATRVQFALCRFDVGTGAFSRAKHMLIHLTGAECAAVRRGRGNAKKPEAQATFGMCHCELAITSAEECTVEAVLELLRRACVSDDGLEAPSLEALRESMERFVAEAEARAAAAKAQRRTSLASDGGPPAKPTAAALGVELQRAVRLVSAPNGAFNWVLVRNENGKPALDDAGAGSVSELVARLDDSHVQFGVLRLSFGKGRFRRTKWVFVHWAGASASALRRGRDNAALGVIRPTLGPTSIDLHATGPSREELSLPEVIEKVRRVFVVDGELSADDAARLLSVEAFEEALEEDEAALAEEFGLGHWAEGDDTVADEEDGDALPLLRDAVAAILDPEDPSNFVVVNAA